MKKKGTVSFPTFHYKMEQYIKIRGFLKRPLIFQDGEKKNIHPSFRIHIYITHKAKQFYIQNNRKRVELQGKNAHRHKHTIGANY